jgi:hypothetical protein
VSACKACGAEILWATVENSGKKMPVNVTPDDTGNIVLCGNARAIVLKYDERAHYLFAGNRLYTCHFATCERARSAAGVHRHGTR